MEMYSKYLLGKKRWFTIFLTASGFQITGRRKEFEFVNARGTLLFLWAKEKKFPKN
tara:strand:- start:923 stop:1090 length:168 start_codon:yes stop_codon:yes gene_type:complete